MENVKLSQVVVIGYMSALDYYMSKGAFQTSELKEMVNLIDKMEAAKQTLSTGGDVDFTHEEYIYAVNLLEFAAARVPTTPINNFSKIFAIAQHLTKLMHQTQPKTQSVVEDLDMSEL